MTACMLLSPVEPVAVPVSVQEVAASLEALNLLDTGVSVSGPANTAPNTGLDRNSYNTGLPHSGKLAAIDDILLVRYAPGEGLFSHVSFVGCSPVVNLGDDTGQACNLPNVEIGLTAIHDRPFLLTGNSQRIPVCAGCGQRQEGWQAQLAESAVPELVCDHCGEARAIADINWGKTAGYTRFAVVIKGVYPREAIPADTLLQTLSRLTDCDWKVAWLESPFLFFRFTR